MIVLVIGTKAELIKMAPIIKEFDKRKIEYLFIHTGHHNINKSCEEFGIRKPDLTLFKPPKKTSKFFLKTRKALMWGQILGYKLFKTLRRIKNIDIILIHGDTITTGVSSVVGRINGLNIGHVESGLRSNDIFEPFPEEIMRVVADRNSNYLFAVSKHAVNNLKKEKVRGKIFLTGNTVLDSVKLSLKLGKSRHKNHVIVNIHRNENLQSKIRMKKIVEIIKLIDEDIEVFWPIHDNTLYSLKKYNLWNEIKNRKNIEFSPLISYFDFINEMKNSKFIITDGGSIQEESLALRKPCLIMRLKTERVEGLKTGLNFLTYLNVDLSNKIIEKLIRGKITKKITNPYGKPGVSKKIVDIVEKIHDENLS